MLDKWPYVHLRYEHDYSDLVSPSSGQHNFMILFFTFCWVWHFLTFPIYIFYLKLFSEILFRVSHDTAWNARSAAGSSSPFPLCAFRLWRGAPPLWALNSNAEGHVRQEVPVLLILLSLSLSAFRSRHPYLQRRLAHPRAARARGAARDRRTDQSQFQSRRPKLAFVHVELRRYSWRAPCRHPTAGLFWWHA